MNQTLLNIDLVEALQIILVIGVLVVFYKYIKTFGVYKVNKPFAWEEAVNNKKASKNLVSIEKGFKDKVRFYNLWFQVERLKMHNIPGVFAELGVYKGETAKAIHAMDQDRKFYLFDTFKGFTKNDLANETQTGKRFTSRFFADTDLEKVKDYIDGNENVYYKPGYFPDTIKGMEDELFALVNIDADLYVPTKAALHFFYPKLISGGVIIVHDYNHNWEGVQKAINEFMPTIPESLIELSDWQGSVMIIKNS